MINPCVLFWGGAMRTRHAVFAAAIILLVGDSVGSREAFAQDGAAGFVVQGDAARFSELREAFGDTSRSERVMLRDQGSIYIEAGALSGQEITARIAALNAVQPEAQDFTVEFFNAAPNAPFAIRDPSTLNEEQRLALQELGDAGPVTIVDEAPDPLLDRIFQGRRGDDIVIPIPGALFSRFRLAPYALDLNSPDGTRVWRGVATQDGAPWGYARIFEREGVLSGRVVTPAGFFKITPLSDGAYALVPQTEPHIRDHPDDDDNWDRTRDHATQPTSTVPPSEPAYQCPTSRASELNLLVYYTAEAAHGQTEFLNNLREALYELHDALPASEIGPRQLNVSTNWTISRMAYNDDRPSACAGETCGGGQGPGYRRHLSRLMGRTDGYFSQVHRERAALDADIVLLIVNDDYACGLAAAGSRNFSTVDTAFAVIASSCIGKRSALVHEVGHLLSAGHDEPVNTSYRQGYADRQGRWGTIMAEVCYDGGPQNLCPRSRYPARFSGRQSVPASAPDATHRNNARAVLEHGPCVAGFGPQASEFPAELP